MHVRQQTITCVEPSLMFYHPFAVICDLFFSQIILKIATSCPPTFLTRDTAADHGCGTSASHGVPAYVLAFAGTQCINPYRNSQAELYVKSQK